MADNNKYTMIALFLAILPIIVQGQAAGKPPTAGFMDMPWLGVYELFSPNSGVSAMHMQIMPKNGKAIMYDSETCGKSNIQLPPNRCHVSAKGVVDCWAHGVEFDINTAKVRPLFIETDTWCSSGGLTPGGRLLSTGGNAAGVRSIRHFPNCFDEKCELVNTKYQLADPRWYGTQCMLPDGRALVAGGRQAFSYEILTPDGAPAPRQPLPFLQETLVRFENNLYPFIHLLPDGNLFVFANTDSIHLDPYKNLIIKRFPKLLPGCRSYPPSGTSVLLPYNLDPATADINVAEVLICGGGPQDAWPKAEQRRLQPALDSCGKIRPLDPNPQWEMDKMPMGRLMSDSLILPNSRILIINGAQIGSSGWTFGDDPCFKPMLYTSEAPLGQRFKLLAPTTIPRMYHSSSAVLPEGKILLAGSNPHEHYEFDDKYPTELRIEKYSPPYLDPVLAKFRPAINEKTAPQGATYGNKGVKIPFTLPGQKVTVQDIMVTIYKPPFTTHGFSMDQRMLILPVKKVDGEKAGAYNVQVDMPKRPEIAPPGYYLLSVVYKGIPSAGLWFHFI